MVLCKRLNFLLCLFVVVYVQQIISQVTQTDEEIEKKNNCRCVQYYLCSDNYIITDGSGLIDVRAGSDTEVIKCNGATIRCCRLRNSTAPIIDNTTIIVKNPVLPKPNSTLQCGQVRTRSKLINLKPELDSASTVVGEIPWNVAIFKLDTYSNTYKFKCGGSLIHRKVVLTATHCVKATKDPSLLKVVATGKDSLQFVEDSSEKEVKDVSKIIKHDLYYSGGLYNDIALLILTEPYDFTSIYINSICLPNVNEVFDGQRCLVSGWGQLNDGSNRSLRKVDVPIVESQHCQDLLRKTRLGEDFELHSSFVCAGGEEGKDTRKGDGGGPLVCLRDDSTYVQVGIVAWGVGDGQKDVPGLYANVANLREWIDEQFSVNKNDIE